MPEGQEFCRGASVSSTKQQLPAPAVIERHERKEPRYPDGHGGLSSRLSGAGGHRHGTVQGIARPLEALVRYTLPLSASIRYDLTAPRVVRAAVEPLTLTFPTSGNSKEQLKPK